VVDGPGQAVPPPNWFGPLIGTPNRVIWAFESTVQAPEPPGGSPAPPARPFPLPY